MSPSYAAELKVYIFKAASSVIVLLEPVTAIFDAACVRKASAPNFL